MGVPEVQNAAFQELTPAWRRVAWRALVGAAVAAWLATAWTPVAAKGLPQAAVAKQVDAIFAEYGHADSPGCALAAIKDGAIVYENGYGMADIEHHVPIRPETVFYIGSVSKQFTAMAAALAIQEGKIGLDDDIRRFVPELPDYGRPITVRHLVHHTSGLRDIYSVLSAAGRRDQDAFDNYALLRIVAKHKELNFMPGDEHLYSNSGYAVLALVVERATGTPFAEYAETKIFRPLGMTVSHFHDDISRLVEHRAYAYQRGAGGQLRLNNADSERVGAGG
ncbi:MAG: class A beta-lactamase-related serine hydrolase, partial [Acidobacteria bacterium]